MKKRSLKNLIHLVPSIPFFLLVVLFLLLPFCNTAIESFKDPKSGAVTIQNFITIFAKPVYRVAVWNSVKVAVIGTAAGMVISFLTALAITSLGGRPRKLFMPILNMTQNFAGFPLAFSFMLMFGYAGFLRLAASHAGLSVLDGYNLYSGSGMIPLFIWLAIPLGTLLLIPAFEGVHREWKESATLMGASRVQFWLKVGIPNLAPSLLGTTSMMFADSITTYTTVYMLLSSNAIMLPIKIASMFSGDSKQQTELGSALSITMIAIILLVMAGTNLAKRKVSKGGVR